jgi:RNA polymerase sigma factor (sigma-70 family)
MLTDAELVDGVVAGYDNAFAELYERHSLAAWRLGQTVTGNADDAADAVAEAFARVLVAVRAGHLANGSSFRSYLLTATRNAALDNIRKTNRARPTEQEDLTEVACTLPTPPDHLSSDEEAALVAEAFRNLPERWRSVLWLTEVEGMPTKDAARRLGLSPNGAAQLAVRARAGLRERFLQAHLRQAPPPVCQTTVDRLGAYVGGGLSPRDLAKVDQHLAGCAACQVRKNELADLGSTLRRAGVPVPLVLGSALSASGLGAGLAASAAPVAAGKAAKALAWAHQAWAHKAAAAAAASALALGAGGAYVAGSGSDKPSSTAPMVSVAAEPSEPPTTEAPSTTTETVDTDGAPPAAVTPATTDGDAEGSATSEAEQAAAPCSGSAGDAAGAEGEAATGATGDDDATATGAGAEGEFEAASGRRLGGLAGASAWLSRSDSGEQTQGRRSWKTLPKVEAELEDGLGAQVDPVGEGSQAELDLAGVAGCVDQGDLGGVDVDVEEIVVPGVGGSGN